LRCATGVRDKNTIKGINKKNENKRKLNIKCCEGKGFKRLIEEQKSLPVVSVGDVIVVMLGGSLFH
jgi:hypothetical protein